jgi:glutaredoxin
LAAREDYAGRNVAVEYKDVKVDSAALDEMLVHSKGKRVVPVIVDGSDVIIGFGGT